MPEQVPDLPVEEFASAKAWERWLARHHATAPGLWLKIAKKGTGVVTVDITDAIEVALCYGWIDGLRHAARRRRTSGSGSRPGSRAASGRRSTATGSRR